MSTSEMSRPSTSWLRIVLLVLGLLAVLPMTLFFGIVGFGLAAIFILLAAFAK